METENCYCGNQATYTDCCEKLHRGTELAETAEQLMRSRYSAFVVGNIEYITETHDPSGRDSVDFEGNQAWSSKADWKSLKILHTEKGSKEDITGVVEFLAKYDWDGELKSHHEISEFKKQKGRWYYVDGKNPDVVTFQREAPKVGRNDPCICGSGKKYKKCCG